MLNRERTELWVREATLVVDCASDNVEGKVKDLAGSFLGKLDSGFCSAIVNSIDKF
jgi:hypothetical protein